MKWKNQQLKELLQEQAAIEQRPLAAEDIEAYVLLFESLDAEKKAQASKPSAISIEVADAVMAEVAVLEARKDRKVDNITLMLAISLGLLATAISYYFIDLPLFNACVSWLKEHISIVAFVVAATCLIQLADKKLVARG